MKNLVLISALMSQCAFAAEHSVKQEELKQSFTVNAQAVPTTSHALSLKPKKWKNFPIVELLPQGTEVKKGQSVVGLDVEALEQEIAKQEKEQIVRLLNLDKVKRDYLSLEKKTKRELDKAKRNFDRKSQDVKHALEVTLPDMEKDIDQRLANEKNAVEYYEDEYFQLKKMYDEDKITEETEEIILKRGKFQYERAKRAYEKLKKQKAHERKVTIPRLVQDWKLSHVEAEVAYKQRIEDLEHSLKLKKEALGKETRTVQEWVDYLTALKKDLVLAQMKSPVDGVLYYGSFEQGYWDYAYAQKVLVLGGHIPTEKQLFTVISKDAKLGLSGYVESSARAALKKNQTAQWQIDGLVKKTNVTVQRVAKFPELGGKWRVDFNIDVPKGAFLQPGSKATFDVVSYKKEKAIAVPRGSVIFDKKAKTTSVKVKVADGSFEKRAVKLGKVVGDKVEILSGLEADQTIWTP